MTTAKKIDAKKRYHVRLRRYGPQDEFGLASMYFGGKLYKRAKVYTVDAPTRSRLKRTRKFEDILEEDLAEVRAATERGSSRGVSIGERARIKRRDAVQKRRPSAALADGPDYYESDDPSVTDPEDGEDLDDDGDESVAV